MKKTTTASLLLKPQVLLAGFGLAVIVFGAIFISWYQRANRRALAPTAPDESSASFSNQAECVGIFDIVADGVQQPDDPQIPPTNNPGPAATPVASPTSAPTSAPTSVPIPTNAAVSGRMNQVNCTTVTGWACLASQPSQRLTIRVYRGNPNQPGASLLGTTTADVPRNTAVASACGGDPNHGFRFDITKFVGLSNADVVDFYATAVDPVTNQETLLDGAPLTYNQANCSNIQSNF